MIAIDPYVLDSLMPDLVGHDRRPGAYIVYLALWGLARGGDSAAISLQSLATATGLSKSAVQRSLLHLKRRGLVAAETVAVTHVPRYRILRPWVRG